MSRKVELEIRDLLLARGEVDRVADELIRRWDTFSYADEDAEAIAQFLLNAGLYPSLIDRISSQIQKNHKVLWPYYAELVGQLSTELDTKVIEAIVIGAKDQELTQYLSRSSALVSFAEEFAKLRKDFDDANERLRVEKYEELKSKIDFLRSQRLFEEEKKAIEALLKFSPSDTSVKLMESEFQERWARHLLSQSSPADISSRAAEKLTENWRREMESIFLPIFESALEWAKKSPETAMDLALMAHFLDFHDEALRLLKEAPDSSNKDWFELELCLETRRFISALDVIVGLEHKYAGDPEANFALTLAKAKAFWGVGKSAKAIDLLTSIQNVRPNYRSVSSLLHQWRGGTL